MASAVPTFSSLFEYDGSQDRAKGALPAPQWWCDEALLHRFICDLLAAEFTALRPAGAALPPLPWDPALHLRRDLGADSLELLQLATALAAAIHLHETGIEDHLLVRPTLGDWALVARTGLAQFSARLSFRTSGSTGHPKTCTHALTTLWQEVAALARLFPQPARILSTVPSHHIYGFLFTVLLPHAFGIAAEPVVDLRSGSAARLRQLAGPGDLVIAHPAFWLTAVPVLPGIAPGVIGVTSTAPCPDMLGADLRAAGLSSLMQIFGSSETAGIGWRDQESRPFALFEFWQRDPTLEHALLRAMPDGSTASFTAGDALIWTDDRHFLPVGRRDAAVQVGGINVYPDAVRKTLLAHPEVRDAAVRLMRSDEGLRLKAFIVPTNAKADPAALHTRLTVWIDVRLSAPERPRALTFGAQCPVGQNGKDADWIIG